MEEVYGYDARNRVTSLTTRTSGQTTRLAQTYTYDDASNVLTHTKGTDTTTYTYDDIGQLLTENRTGYSASYTYDANGNRASRTVGGVTETFHNDAGDKLTHITVGGNTVKSFTYDAAGRTTRVTVGANQTDLEYDFESRVTRILKSGTTTNTFTYNGLSARVGKVDSGGTLTYRRAGAGVLAPVLGDGSATYTPGISERRGSTTSYAHHGLKNAEAQSQSGQTITASRQYDAFGNLSSSTGTFQGYFGYAGAFGYQEDGDHSLRLLGHRYYDSSTGRFLTRDPIKDGRNWYAYGAGGTNPLTFADPTGLWVVSVGSGYHFALPGISNSGSVSIEIDGKSGNVQVVISKGSGHAVGAAGGLTGKVGYNPTGSVDSTNDAKGVVAVGASGAKKIGLGGELEFPVSGTPPDLTIEGSPGGNAKGHVGYKAVAYVEMRAKQEIFIGNAFEWWNNFKRRVEQVWNNIWAPPL